MPTPTRPLSLTDAGWRNIQRASSTNTTGNATATWPKRPPNVYALIAWATALVGRNHSTTAPAIATSVRKNGTPSRRSSFASDSRPKTRAAPPVACASAIQNLTPAFGPLSATSTFVAASLLAGLDERVRFVFCFADVAMRISVTAGLRQAREALRFRQNRDQKRMASITFERTAMTAGIMPAITPVTIDVTTPATAASTGNGGSPAMPAVPNMLCAHGLR